MSTNQPSRADRPLRVGIIGASAGNSWASRSHVPAIEAVPGLELTAVATSRAETAAASAAQFGARHGFVGIEQLVESDDVDLVIVAVKVPTHRDFVAAALGAGKHVYCEWPLGIDVDDSAFIAEAAAGSTARRAVGLQARSSPTLRYLRDLIRDGYIGDVESSSVSAYSARGADPVVPTKRYLFNAADGGNLLSIETGHLLDALAFVLGEPTRGVSNVATRRPTVLDSDGVPFAPDTADTVTAVLTADGGAPLAVHIAQGTHALFTTTIQIIGSAGALRLETTAPGGIQMAPLLLSGAPSTTAQLEPLVVPASYFRVPDPGVSTALNVAEALGAFERDIREGTSSVPDFEAAVARHRSIAAILDARLF